MLARMILLILQAHKWLMILQNSDRLGWRFMTFKQKALYGDPCRSLVGYGCCPEHLFGWEALRLGCLDGWKGGMVPSGKKGEKYKVWGSFTSSSSEWRIFHLFWLYWRGRETGKCCLLFYHNGFPQIPGNSVKSVFSLVNREGKTSNGFLVVCFIRLANSNVVKIS